MVTFRLFSSLRDAVGRKEVEIEADNLPVREALRRFADAHDERVRDFLFNPQGRMWDSIMLLVNGETVDRREDIVLSSGDVVSVLLPTAGG